MKKLIALISFLLLFSDNVFSQTVSSGGSLTTTSVWPTASVIAGNSVTAPGVGAAIVTIASGNLPAGNYEVIVTAGYGGTAGVLNNMELRKGSTVIGSLYVPAVANREVQVVVRRVTVDGTQAITVNATAAAGAGEVYNAHIIVTRSN